MISEVANRNLALRFAVPSQDRVKRVAGKGSAFVGNMIIPLCRMARIRAANFTSCARVPLQDNETIHKLSTVLLYSSAAIDRSQFLSFASCFLSPPPRDKPKEIHPVSFISSPRQCQLLSRCRNPTNWKITFSRLLDMQRWKHQKNRAPLFPYDACLPAAQTGTTSFHLLFSCFFFLFFFFFFFFQLDSLVLVYRY